MRDEEAKATQFVQTEDKRPWEAPRIFSTALDDTETQILAGTEIIIYVS